MITFNILGDCVSRDIITTLYDIVGGKKTYSIMRFQAQFLFFQKKEIKNFS